MQKVQRQWKDVAKDLEAHLTQCKLNYSELSTASCVDYYAIRRMRISGIHNQTNNAKDLCTYFKIPIVLKVKVQPDEFGRLVSELESTWDGSEPHAKLLTKLIRSTKSFRVEGREES